MPGVPSSRGCDACRKQKKKCDQSKPRCSRCTRLHIDCVGSGQQRYTFKDQTTTLRPRRAQMSQGSALTVSRTLVPGPENRTTSLLVSQFQSHDIRYDLTYYGAFLKDIPGRLGTNAALDASVDAFCSTFPSVYTHQQTPEMLGKYIRALRTLRLQLSNRDPAKAYSCNTLCAIYLLDICQSWIRKRDDPTWCHGEMMAYFLNNAPLQDWQGNFEVQLLVTLSAAVAVESFANPRINLNQFFTNFSNTYGELHGPRRPGDDDNYPIDCLKLSNLAKIGEYFRNPEQYLSNIVSAYQELRDATPTVRQRMNRWTESLVLAGVPLQSYPVTKQLMVFKALLGVSNSLSLLLNTILRIYSPSDTLIEDLELYTNEIIQLANDTSQYRPLGSGYMPICIGIAWAATSGTPKQVEVGRVLADWQTDFENIRWLETAAWLEQRFEVLRLSVSAPRPRHKVDRWMRIDQFRESGDTSAPSSCVLL